MARSTARKRALNTLYEADEKGQDILSLLAERIARPGAQTPLPEYAVTIVHGVADHVATIDRALTEHSTGWNIKRMAVVDRNILRIAAWEIIGNDEVPDKVAIDEALNLAKTLSDAESLSFIHGLLSSLCLDKAQYDFDGDVQQDAQRASQVATDDVEPTSDGEPSADGEPRSDGEPSSDVDTGTAPAVEPLSDAKPVVEPLSDAATPLGTSSGTSPEPVTSDDERVRSADEKTTDQAIDQKAPDQNVPDQKTIDQTE